MLTLWSLMHGTAILLIRGGVSEPLHTQMFHACRDGQEAIIQHAARSKTRKCSGPPWPRGLVLGEAAQSKVNGESEKRQGAGKKAANRSRLQTVRADT
jgi:hypothetical protein